MLKKAAFLNACLRKISNMGSGNSKSSPDDQMRMKMENGFEEDDDDDMEALAFPERDRPTRSKSNLSFHTAERFQNADGDEYFNKIYNKRSDKSLNPLGSAGGGSIGVKSAPPGTKKEKDPEVAAAIAELEETFKVLGDSAGPPRIDPPTETHHESRLGENQNGVDNRTIESFSPEDDSRSSPTHTDSSTRESDESGLDSQSESPPCPLQYDRHLITRAGESSHGLLMMDPNGSSRRSSNRGIGTSGGYSNITYSSGGSHMTVPSRGLETRGLMISSQSRRNHNSQSILLQQRKDFQRMQATDSSRRDMAGKSNDESDMILPRQEDWTYNPPKIDGFDIAKFKEINSKNSKMTTSSIVPIILRDDDDTGYYSRSPEIPAYTKDELELIASLEREVY